MGAHERRHKRQLDLIPNVFYHQPVVIIGCGAIGRQVALQLASAGVSCITIIDDDTVSEHNLSNQGFKEADLDKPKVVVTKDDIMAINSKAHVSAINERFNKSTLSVLRKHEADLSTVFCCVDSITTRKEIFELLKEDTEVFIDGRMSAESMRIISVFTEEREDKIDSKAEFYESTLFEASEAQGGRCTARSTIYCANVAAGMMVSQYTKIIRGRLPKGFMPERDFCLNLLANVIEHL